MIIIGIYKITSPSGKIYIGSSKDIEKRIKHYKTYNCPKQYKLLHSLKKYSWENHTFEIVEECEEIKLLSLERAWGDFYNVLSKDGLNCKLPGPDSVSQCMSNETRQKIINSNKGQKRSEKTKEKMRNRVISAETRLKISEYSKNRSPELQQKITNSLIGRKLSEKHKQKLSEIFKGRVFSKEWGERIAISKYKLILDLNTGVFYESAKEVSDLYGYKPSQVRNMLNLNNPTKNITSFVYA